MTKVIKLKLVPSPNEYDSCDGCVIYTGIVQSTSCAEVIAMAKKQGVGSCLVGRQEGECIYIEDKENEMLQKSVSHIHKDAIIAWANGAEIEYREINLGNWQVTFCPSFVPTYEYRVKVEKKEDIIRYYDVEMGGGINDFENEKSWYHNLQLTFDGETKKLISAEVI